MIPTEASGFRAAAARINYLSEDRADFQFAAKELSRKMSAPVVSDWEAAKSVAKYVKYKPKAIQLFRFERCEKALQRMCRFRLDK